MKNSKNFSWQYVHVFRDSLGDCTNGGLSSKRDIIMCFDGELEAIKNYIAEKNVKAEDCLYVVRRELWGEPHPYLTPLNWAIEKPASGPVMMGGNYANGDSRWHDWFEHYLPLPIHDRLETWEEYEMMSR